MKIMNLIIKGIILITAILYSIKYGMDKELSYTLISLSLFILVFIPNILRKFKVKIPPEMEFLYLLFILFAQVLGSMMKLYDSVLAYDKIVHFTSGILSAFIGVYLLTVYKKYDKKSIVFNAIFILFTSLAVAALWEIFEFSCDSILGNDAQRVISTGVNDTMLDIIMALLASILVTILYLYEETNNKSIIIKGFIKKLI